MCSSFWTYAWWLVLPAHEVTVVVVGGLVDRAGRLGRLHVDDAAAVQVHHHHLHNEAAEQAATGQSTFMECVLKLLEP